MLNNVTLMGRLTRDPETRYMQNSDNSVTRFTLAIDRDFQRQGEERQSDFINCMAWNKTGEFIQKYFSKGAMLAVTGRIQTGNYTNKDGVKVYTTEVVAERASFTGEKREASGAAPNPQNAATGDDDFMNVPEGDFDGLPFN